MKKRPRHTCFIANFTKYVSIVEHLQTTASGDKQAKSDKSLKWKWFLFAKIAGIEIKTGDRWKQVAIEKNAKNIIRTHIC